MRFLLALTFLWSSFAFAAPLRSRDFPDPGVLRTADGTYYAYGSQGTVPGAKPSLLNVQIATSRDLVHWRLIGDAFPEKPTWAKDQQKIWAPDVRKIGARYVLYFAAEPNTGGQSSCLGVAIADRPEGPFKDRGTPLSCELTRTALDPNSFLDPASGKLYLYWGSGPQSLRARMLASDGLDFQSGSLTFDVLSPSPPGSPDSYRHLIEAPWVTFHDGFYYLFFSGDNCCDPGPHYAIMVARSRAPLGPFTLLGDALHRPDSVVLEQFDRFIAPGHNAVVDGPDGRLWTLFHAISRREFNVNRRIEGDRLVRRILLVSPLGWRDGWPTIDPRDVRVGEIRER